VRLYTTAYHNSAINRLQPLGINRHAVFLMTESEAITYNYELDLLQTSLNPDPRIAHTLNLQFDAYGRALQSVAVVYPRLVSYEDPANLLNQDQRDLIRNVQNERHIAYTETHFTDELPDDPDQHRLPAPCEVLTYELTGTNNTNGFVPSVGLYFSLDDLRAFKLSETLPDQGPKSVISLAYHEQPADERAHKRLVEWVRMLYWKDDLTGPKPLGTNAWLGLSYETYKLALTRDLLGAVFGSKLTPEVFTALNTTTISGYTAGTALSSALTNQWWMRSGVAGFTSDAAQHFYLPERYTDPFGNETTLQYDGTYDLFIQSSTDALGNSNGVALDHLGKPRFDYRVLAPLEMVDPNGNHIEVYVDILGMVVATAVKGKGTEGDDLVGFNDELANPPASEVQAFCTAGEMDVGQARTWLGHATARFVYHFGEGRDTNGNVTGWATRPAGACGIARETHKDLASKLQVALECSDGSGNVLMKKVQAEPEQEGGPLRWIINGLTVLNNKGKPVKQYEPAFSDRFGCEMPGPNGVTPIIYYDAAGRVVRTELPDGTFSRVEFSPWHVKTFDANDTVLESRWYSDRNPLPHDQPLPRDSVTGEISATSDQRAAWLAAQHADTPAHVHLDSLGREVIAIAHNRTNGFDERYLTFTKLDAEGKPLWICDARGNLVMQYITPPKFNHTPLYDQPNPDWRPAYDMPLNAVPCYDIAGNLLFQHSMDAGDRWMLMDAAGKPMLAWDMNDKGVGTAQQKRLYRTEYDQLHRPTAQWLTVDTDAPIMVERYEYRDTNNPDGTRNPQLAQDKTANVLGQLIRHYDPSGLVETIRRDFKGNVQEVRRTLIKDATVSVVDWQGNLAGKLEAETYVQLTEHDALNRMVRQENWHKLGGVGAVYTPIYNERGALKSETFTLRGAATNVIENVRYNAKGQKEYLELGNGTLTQYDYDLKTFRLKQIRTTRPADASDFPDRHSNLQDIGIIQQLHYTYDPVGNITEIYDEAYKPVFFANAIVEPKGLYEFDALYRLILATGRENGNASATEAPGQFDREESTAFPIQAANAIRRYTQHYQYDSVGNILQMNHVRSDTANGWTRSYDYAFNDPAQPANNRLWRTWEHAPDWNDTGASNKVTYRYDTHGNMLNLANVAPGQHLQWDHRDMIKSLDLIGGGMAHYQYDAGKQRTRKYLEREVTNPDGTKRWVRQWERIYLGGYESYRRYNGNGTTPVEEIESHHLFEGEQRVLLVDDVINTNRTHADGTLFKTGPIYRYQYSNHLGSAWLELDDQAEIISYEEYHPYGTSAYRAMKSGTEAPPKRYRYTGMERDEETGLSYHSARYYIAWLGRWSAADAAGISSGINLYLYGKANPCGAIDRTGLQDEQVTKDSKYYGRMADWFYGQGWMAESAEYRELQHKATFDEAMTEFRKVRAENAVISNTALTVLILGPIAIAAGIELGVAALPFIAKHYALVTGIGSFGIGLLDPNPVGSIDLPGGLDDAGRATRQGIRAALGGAAEAVGKDVKISPELEKQLLSEAPQRIADAMKKLEELNIDTSLMRARAASQSQLAAFAEATGKKAEDIAAFYSPRQSGEIIKMGDLFTTAAKSDEESAVVNVTLATLEAARRDPNVLVTKLAHEASELNNFFNAFANTTDKALTKSQFALLEREFHAIAEQTEVMLMEFLKTQK
jgi:RHS repeat-associated protein